MYFTQEDYRKIENWLKQNAIKDSDFSFATSLTGEEFITLLQDGSNKKTTLDTFSAMFSSYLDSYAREDLFNVTKYLYNTSGNAGASIVNLEEATSKCPKEIKRGGQIITFLNKESVWEVWRFLGTTPTEWGDLTSKWKCMDGRESLGIDVTLDDTPVNAGSTKTTTIVIKTKDGGKASLISLYINSVLVQEWNSMNEASKELTISTDSDIKVIVKEYGIQHEYQKTISVVYPCFIGASSVVSLASDIINNPIYLSKGELAGKFTVTTTASKPFIYSVLPEIITVGSMSLNSVEIPTTITQLTKDGFIYNVYQSDVSYDPGTYDIFVGSYTGDYEDLVKSLQYRVTALETKVELLNLNNNG